MVLRSDSVQDDMKRDLVVGAAWWAGFVTLTAGMCAVAWVLV